MRIDRMERTTNKTSSMIQRLLIHQGIEAGDDTEASTTGTISERMKTDQDFVVEGGTKRIRQTAQAESTTSNHNGNDD